VQLSSYKTTKNNYRIVEKIPCNRPKIGYNAEKGQEDDRERE
jgi:hypothetical protein